MGFKILIFLLLFRTIMLMRYLFLQQLFVLLLLLKLLYELLLFSVEVQLDRVYQFLKLPIPNLVILNLGFVVLPDSLKAGVEHLFKVCTESCD